LTPLDGYKWKLSSPVLANLICNLSPFFIYTAMTLWPLPLSTLLILNTLLITLAPYAEFNLTVKLNLKALEIVYLIDLHGYVYLVTVLPSLANIPNGEVAHSGSSILNPFSIAILLKITLDALLN